MNVASSTMQSFANLPFMTAITTIICFSSIIPVTLETFITTATINWRKFYIKRWTVN